MNNSTTSAPGSRQFEKPNPSATSNVLGTRYMDNVNDIRKWKKPLHSAALLAFATCAFVMVHFMGYVIFGLCIRLLQVVVLSTLVFHDFLSSKIQVSQAKREQLVDTLTDLTRSIAAGIVSGFEAIIGGSRHKKLMWLLESQVFLWWVYYLGPTSFAYAAFVYWLCSPAIYACKQREIDNITNVIHTRASDITQKMPAPLRGLVRSYKDE
jgi:hypothetical protein